MKLKFLDLGFASHFVPRFRALCLVLFALAQVFFGCGCATISKQPVQIPALVPGDEKFGASPKLAGRYANEGEAFTVKGEKLGPVLLSRLLLVDNFAASHSSNYVNARYGVNPAHAAADSITVLQLEPDMIEMQFFEQGQPVATRRFSEYTWRRATAAGWGIFAHWDGSKYGHPYYAVKGFMDIETRAEIGGIPGIGGSQEADECLLRKAVDGSLIVLYREEYVGILVIVPLWRRYDVWCRFPPIADSSQPQPSP
jgi:hypothetical protein